jgi:hypothetical protein
VPIDSQVRLGGTQQHLALAGAFPGEQRVLAHHQPLAREIRAADLGHITLVEERGLQRPTRGGQLLNGRRPQGGDPIEARRAQRLLDPRLGDHATV